MSFQLVAAENYEKWRADADKRLRSEKSWLSVVGLHWLKEGQNSLGSDFKNELRLPKSAEKELGFIEKTGDSYTLHLKNPKLVKIDGKVAEAKEVPIKSDAGSSPTIIEHKDIEFFLITRKNGTALRVKDPNSEARKNFKGRQWFPVKENYVIKGKWKAFKEPKKIIIPDVLGNNNEELVPGVVSFEYQGKKYELSPTMEGEDLFIVFKDATSGVTTYGSARFLYANIEKDGNVTLDFNKATNPPCAVTDYATCPRAPKENILPFKVEAGELPPLK